ncbi:MAG: A/G-specific adenine glycosylase [Lachnospiraceae bacterium]|nr:A/G-specific adenine glycosylase [Lachnospiraceae bacterium]
MDRLEEMIPYLLHWYRYNARVLPWREDPSAYHVWISEIMLQQTRVEAVRSYYQRFLAELPDIRSLAECPDDRLMKLWEGLGYYSRCRNLKKAAQLVCEQYGGELPADYKKLRELPGIGDYTAGAVSSIAFGLPEPAVDGNLLRVCARLTGSREDILSPAVKKNLTERLRAVMPEKESGALNQALMDLGAGICLPNGTPHCEDCPLMHLCVAFSEGTVSEIPVRAAKKERRTEKRTVFLLFKEGRVLLHKRPEKGLLAGLYEFPNVSGALTAKAAKEALKELLPMLSLTDGKLKKEEDAVHIFTHIKWEMKAYRGTVSADDAALPEGYIWADENAFEAECSVPSAFGKWDVFSKKG